MEYSVPPLMVASLVKLNNVINSTNIERKNYLWKTPSLDWGLPRIIRKVID